MNTNMLISLFTFVTLTICMIQAFDVAPMICDMHLPRWLNEIIDIYGQIIVVGWIEFPFLAAIIWLMDIEAGK